MESSVSSARWYKSVICNRPGGFPILLRRSSVLNRSRCSNPGLRATDKRVNGELSPAIRVARFDTDGAALDDDRGTSVAGDAEGGARTVGLPARGRTDRRAAQGR